MLTKKIKLEEIIRRHPRHAELFEPSADLSGLKESVEKGGKLNPIHLMEMENGSLELIDGLSSMTVAAELGQKEIDAIIHPYCDDPLDLIVDLNTNLHRSYVEQFKMIEAYWTKEAPGQGARTDLDENESDTSDEDTYQRIARKIGIYKNGKPNGSVVKKIRIIGTTQSGFLLSMDDGNDSMSKAYNKCCLINRKRREGDGGGHSGKIKKPDYVSSETDVPAFDPADATVTETADASTDQVTVTGQLPDEDGDETFDVDSVSAAADSEQLQSIVDRLLLLSDGDLKKVLRYTLKGQEVCPTCGRQMNEGRGNSYEQKVDLR